MRLHLPHSCLLLPLLLLLLGPGGGHGGAPCWEALLRCQDEPECGSAYSQSRAACQAAPGRARAEPGCPSHCVAALARLNGSRSGAALERCECGRDARCLRLKASLEPCLARALLPPSRRRGLGCTAARARCQLQPACRAPLAAYLARCGQLFNGRRCSGACRAAIALLLAAPGGPALERCVCDGPERPVCQALKASMGRLCFGPLEDEQDDYRDEEEEEEGGEGQPGAPRGGSWVSSACGTTAWQGLALGGGILPLWLFWC